MFSCILLGALQQKKNAFFLKFQNYHLQDFNVAFMLQPVTETTSKLITNMTLLRNPRWTTYNSLLTQAVFFSVPSLAQYIATQKDLIDF